MSAAASSPTGSVRADRIAELQQRVHQLQGTTLSQPVPTLPALRPLLSLRTGASYAVDSPALAMALMAGPSAAGWWSAVVGLPELGIESAAAVGVALERTVLVPDPGADWLTVLATLADVLPVVVARPPTAVGPHDAARLTARLRQRGAVLIAVGDWPRADARLRVVRSHWSGIGAGHGHLAGRLVTVQARRADARGTEVELCWPDGSAGLRAPEPDQRSAPDLTLVEAVG